MNSAIASKLEQRLGAVQYDNFAVHFKVQRAIKHAVEIIRVMLEEGADISPPVTDEVREDYKFGECVPEPLLETMIALRFSCKEGWNELKRRNLKIVNIC